MTSVFLGARMMKQTLERLRAEFLEMPGLHFTAEQTQRLCGVDPAICSIVLDTLVTEGFLCVKANGVYARTTEGAFTRPRPGKTVLSSAIAIRRAS